MRVNESTRPHDRARDRLDAVQRRLGGVRRAESEALTEYRRVAARYFERGDEREMAEAECALARARREVARAQAAAEHWRAALVS